MLYQYKFSNSDSKFAKKKSINGSGGAVRNEKNKKNRNLQDMIFKKIINIEEFYLERMLKICKRKNAKIGKLYPPPPSLGRICRERESLYCSRSKTDSGH